MRIQTIIKSTLLFTILTLAMPVSAQDMIARQTPVDRKVKPVDSTYFKRRGSDEMVKFDFNLEDDWQNNKVHNRQAQIPERMVIDLSDFTMPTTSTVVTSNYGPRWGRRHEGLDIKVYTGDTIRAAFSGKVRIVKWDSGYGKYIVIKHPNGLETVYGHLSRQLVKENQDVRSGDVIGLGGNTGRSSGSHLHFETMVNGVPINPALLFDFRNQDVTGDTYTLMRKNYQRESNIATRERGKIGNGSYTREQVKGKAYVEKPNTNYNDETSYYKVKQGETLYSIAKRCNVTVEHLIKQNNLKQNETLKAGRLLKYKRVN